MKTKIIIAILLLTFSLGGCSDFGYNGIKGDLENQEETNESLLAEDALTVGIIYGHHDLVIEAIGEGASVEAFSKSRKWNGLQHTTPLSLAFSASQWDIANELIEQGATLEYVVDGTDNAGSHLNDIAGVEQDTYLQLLIDKDYDFEEENGNGWNTLDSLFATSGNFDNRVWEIAEVLISHGAQITETTSKASYSNRDIGNENLPRIISYLLENGKKSGLSELEEKIVLGDNEGVLKLLNVKMPKNEIETAGYYIAAYCNTTVLKTVLYMIDEEEWSQGALFRCAARAGNLENIKYLVEEMHWKDTSEGTEPYRSALEQAESNGHYEVVDYLLMKGMQAPDVGMCNAEGWGNLICIDIMNHDFARMRNWLEKGIVPSYFEGTLSTALTIENKEVYCELYEYAKEHNIEMDMQELLSNVIKKNNSMDILVYLLENGNMTDEILNTALEAAVRNNRTTYVNIFLEAGADPNYENIATDAIYNDNLEIVKLLVEHGMDVNTESGLLNYGAQFSNGVLTYLLEQGIDISADGPNKYALIIAVNAGRVKNAKALIDAGMDLTVANEDGNMAYDMAILGGIEDMIALFE